MRHLVQIKTIDAITPIEGADRIERAAIGGWGVVVQKGLYNPGEKAIYLEIDSVLPEDNPLFADFMKHGVKNVVTHDGDTVRGHVLKTVRLRGVYSQGALIPLDNTDLHADATQDEVDDWAIDHGIFKYDPPLPFSNSGIIGVFPRQFARQTDSPRVQNIPDDFLRSVVADDLWVATEKIDGMSATFFRDETGKLRAASRNYEVDTDAGIFAEIIKKYDLETMLGVGSVIQGEIFGEGIQKNPLKMRGHHFAVFYHNGVGSEDFLAWVDLAMKVPDYEDLAFPYSVDEALQQVDGLRSIINPDVQAEGVVWWQVNDETYPELEDRSNFKAINNEFLLKQK